MRKMIALASVLAATSVQAAPSDVQFGDLNYFIKAAQFNLTADVNASYSKFSTEGGDTLETRGYIIDTQYSYGVTRNLTVLFGLDYAFDLENENKTTTTDADYNSDGLSDPVIGVQYRFMGQSQGDMYNVDFGALARISVQDAETGDSTGQQSNDGNFASGQGALEINGAIGRKWNEANEWRVTGGLVYNASGEVTSKRISGDVDTDLDPSYDVFIRGAYQYRPIHNFMMALSLQATRIGEIDSEAAGVDNSQDSHIDYDFTFTAKYLVTDNVITKFNFGRSIYPDFDTEVGSTNAEIHERRSNFYGLGVDLLF